MSYDWSVFSPDEILPGEVELVRENNTRMATVTGRAVGAVIVRATARDADGRAIATGTLDVNVTE